jgi:hypothetical protein
LNLAAPRNAEHLRTVALLAIALALTLVTTAASAQDAAATPAPESPLESSPFKLTAGHYQFSGAPRVRT